MMVHLLNSAMMPQPGRYENRGVTGDVFGQALRAYANRGELRSYIGYPETQEMIYRLCGERVELNRKKTELADGDILLIARLRYRIEDPGKKKTEARSSDPGEYEFFICQYRKG